MKLYRFFKVGRHDGKNPARRSYRKLLVAGRVDVGRLSVPRADLDQFVKDRGFDGYVETSANTGEGCQELVNSICEAVDWEHLTKTVSNVTFDRLKSEILKLRDLASLSTGEPLGRSPKGQPFNGKRRRPRPAPNTTLISTQSPPARR